MPTKADFLAKLGEERLKAIAKNEGLTKIPKTFGKRELVKYLDGTLTLEKIKEYVAEVYEKETKREIIRETIKERGVRVKAKETTRIELSKSTLINEIMHGREKLNKSVLKEIATDLHEPLPTGSGYSLYDKMNESLLEKVHNIFVQKKTDGKGKYLEYQFANFIMSKTKLAIPRLEIRHTLSDTIGEIDIVGFDSENLPILMAECKDRLVKYEDMDKWILNVKRIYSECENSLKEAYFVGSKGYTDGVIKRVEKLKEVDEKHGLIKTADVLSKILDWASNDKELGASGGVLFEIYDVRQNQFVKILPRK